MKKRKSIVLVSVVLTILLVGTIGLLTFMNKPDETVLGNKADVEWYTEDGKEFVITTVDELYGLVKLSNYYDFSGQIIKLGADIVVNEGNAEEWDKKAPSKKWFPIDGFAGEFNGEGHVISGVYGVGSETAIGLFSNTKATCKIKNFKLLNSYFEMDGMKPVGSIVANGCGTLEQLYSDAILTSNGERCGGIIGKVNDDGTVSTLAKTTKITNCWFDGKINLITKTGRYGGGIIGQVFGGAVNVEHCLNSGDISCQSEEAHGIFVGGIIGGLSYKNYSGTVALNDTLTVGAIDTIGTVGVGAIVGGTDASTELTITDTYTIEEVYEEICQRQRGSIEGGVPMLNTDFIVGEEWYRWTMLDFDNYWAVTKDDTPVLKCFANEIIDTSSLTKAYSLDWYNVAQYEQVITTKEELYGFALMSYQNTFEGQVITLGNDIVVNEGKATDWVKGKNIPDACWIPIGRNLAFQGVFDGKGHTISGLYGTTDIAFSGLFGWTGIYSEIKNVNVKNSYFETTSSGIGGVAGRVEGQIHTAYSDAILTSTAYSIGGIAGYKKTATKDSFITNCWYAGTIYLNGDTAKQAGGIAGRLSGGNLTIDNCLFTGNIYISGKKHSASTGGFAGYITNGTLTINQSLNDGEIQLTEAEAMSSTNRSIGQIANKETVKVVTKDSYFTRKGYNDYRFYTCVGEEPTIIGSAEAKEVKDILGYKGYQTTALDFDKYWTVVVNADGTPILKSFASKVPSVKGLSKTFDKSWYDQDKDTYVLEDAKDLYGLLYLSNSRINFEDKTIIVANDIVVHQGWASDWAQGVNVPEEAYNWTGIGKNTVFQGTFDGKGHIISGLYGVADTTYMGLFAYAGSNSKITNLSLKNSYFETADTVIGSIAGRTEGRLHTLYSDAILASTSTVVGGMVGNKSSSTQDSTITNCWYAGTIYMNGDAARQAGGIIGRHVNGNLTIDNCLFTGQINIGGKYRSSSTGGFVGLASNGTLTINQCLNDGEIQITEAGKMSYANRSIGQIADKDSLKVITKNSYFTRKGYNASGFYTCVGKGATVVGNPEAKEVEDILGYKGYQTTSLNFNKYWTVVVNSDGTPILKSFASDVPSLDGFSKIFDKSWYDEEKTTYVLNDRKDLYGFVYMLNSNTDFAGKTVTLGRDIVVNSKGTAEEWENGSKTPSYQWAPIGKKLAFQGTFDGKNHTISGICGISDSSYMGLFGRVGTKGKIQNLRIENSYFGNTATGNSYTGSVVGYCSGSISNVYSNAIVRSDGCYIGGFVGYSTGKTDKTITNCWFDGTINLLGDGLKYSGGFVGRQAEQKLEMNNCLFSGTINFVNKTTTDDEVNTGGFCGYVTKNTELSIQNSLNSGKFTVENHTVESLVGLGRVVGRVQVKTGETAKLNIEEVYYTNVGVGGSIKWYAAKSADITGAPIQMNEKNVLGDAAYYNTTLDFEETWSLVTENVHGKDGAPILQCFADKISPLPQLPADVDISWYDKDKDVYTISNEAQLYGFSYLSSMGVTFTGKKISLKNDIEINKVSLDPSDEIYEEDGKWDDTIASVKSWTPIGTLETPFAGTFDGNYFSIQGIYTKVSQDGAGLFGATAEGSSIQNLKLENSYFENSEMITGSIVGQCAGNLVNVYSDAYVESGHYAGGIVGKIQTDSQDTSVDITNCWFAGDILAQGNYQGGIAGTIMNGNISITGCLNTGDINCNSKKRIGGLCGGIICDETDESSRVTIQIENCLNYGAITNYAASSARTAAIVGNIGVGTAGAIKNVYATNECYVGTEAEENVGYGYKAASSGITIDIKKVPIADITTVDNVTISDVANTLEQLDFKKVYTIGSKDTPVLQWTVQLEFDTSWYEGDVANLSISTVDELYSLPYLLSVGENFAGKTISLKKDIIINTVSLDPKDKIYEEDGKWDEMVESVKKWTPIGTLETPFAGTFNGDYFSIQGVYVEVSQEGAGLFGATAEGSIIQNLKLENSYLKNGATITGSIVGQCAGNLVDVYSDAYVESGIYTGGLVGKILTDSKDSRVNITRCWFDGDMKAQGNYQGGIVGYIMNGNINITDCLNSGDIDCNSKKRIGGLCGGAIHDEDDDSTLVTLQMENCLNYGQIHNASTASTARTASVIGNIGVGTTGTIKNVYATNECYGGTEAGVGYGYKANSSGITIDVKKVDVKDITVTDLTKPEEVLAAQNQLDKFDFAETWEIGDSKKPSLQWISALDWYDVEKDNYIISSAKELLGLVRLSRSGNDFAGKTITLGADINFNGGNADENSNSEEMSHWMPIGTLEIPFAGTFDGNGKTISGIYANANADGLGMFAATAKGSSIKNLKLKNSYFKNSATITGSVVGQCAGNLVNVYSNAYVESSHYAGGLIGNILADSSVNLTKCWFAGTIHAQGRQQGGIVGRIMSGNITMVDCLNTGTINCNSKTMIGGLCGSVAIEGGSIKLTMEHCLNYGQITDCKSGTATKDVRTSSVVGNIGGDDTTNGYTVSVKTNDVYTTMESYVGLEAADGIGHGALSNNSTIQKVSKDDIIVSESGQW